jgi:acyl dehydratase
LIRWQKKCPYYVFQVPASTLQRRFVVLERLPPRTATLYCLQHSTACLCDHSQPEVSVKTYQNLAELKALVGSPIGTSDWLTVDQARIDKFADVTGDDQWIHVDPERAAAGMFGSTVAHGFLTLSLLPYFIRSSHKVGGARMSVNYGLNRVRFPAPVPVNSRLRAHFKLLSFEPIEGGVQIVTEVTVEREGQAKPVCVAESVGRLYT